MDFLFSDLRHGVRTLLRTPLTTGSVVASLALGIATTTTMFAVVEAFLLRPLDEG